MDGTNNNNNQFSPNSTSPPNPVANNWPGNTQAQNPNIMQQPFPNSNFSPTPPKRTPVAIIILAVALPIVAGIIILAAILLINVFGGSYEETYTVFDELHEAMMDLDHNSNCYNVGVKMSDDDVSDSTYEKYLSSCADDIIAVVKIADRFGDTYGAKHDPNVKADFEKFKTTLDALYSNERDLRSGLEDYKTWREALSIMRSASSINAYDNPDEYFATVSRATELIRSTEVPAAIEYADGLEERLDILYYSVLSSSLSDRITALNTFNEYVDSVDFETFFKTNIMLIDDLQDEMNSMRESMNALYAEQGGE